MEHMDKKFVELRNLIESLQDKDISKKVVINGEELEFEEFIFWHNKAEIRIPKNFNDMSDEYLRVKYPSENRPKIVKSNEEGSVNITLNYFDIEFSEDQLEELQSETKKGLKIITPTVTFYNEDVIDNGVNKISYYEFKSMALDGGLYNLNFSASINNKLFLGSFNCRISEINEWRIVALQMISTLKDLSK